MFEQYDTHNLPFCGIYHLNKDNIERVIKNNCRQRHPGVKYLIDSPGPWIYGYPEFFNPVTQYREWMPIPSHYKDKYGNSLETYTDPSYEPLPLTLY